MNHPPITQITTWIESNITSVLAHIDPESIAVYNFIQERFQTNTVAQDLIFQFIFRSYYRMDIAGLSPEFKKRYFELMEVCRKQSQLDFTEVVTSLYHIHNLRKDPRPTVQFSFISKMFSTIDAQRPVYDREVARMFSYMTTPIGSLEKKLETYLHRYEHIQSSYQTILKDNLLPKITNAFDQNFQEHGLSEVKQLDFIFWAAGKFKKKGSVNAAWKE